MTKVVLNSALSTYDVGIINANFAKIQTQFQDKVLYRDNPVGEPNTLETDVNANNKRIYNLPEPTTSGEPLRLEDLENVAGNLQDSLDAATEAAASAAAASVSAASASSSASNAASSATSADASELAASNSAASAAGSADTATQQAILSTAYSNVAGGYAGAASASAFDADSSANGANASAIAAGNSATAAAASAVSAAASAASAAGAVSGHISDPTDAHAATAITNTPAGGVVATTVQAAINELDTEKLSTTATTLPASFTASSLTSVGTLSALTVSGVSSITANSASAALKVTQTGAGNAFEVEDQASDTTPFVISASGQVGIGTPSPATGFNYDAVSGDAYMLLRGDTAARMHIRRAGDNGNAPALELYKSRGTFNSPTIVQSGDQVSNIGFLAYDGTQNLVAARIVAEVDGTPGTNDMPGRLVFSTTADGASSPTERVRVDSAGLVSVTGTFSVTGQASFAAGSAAAPAINFASDPDTGIFRVDTNALGIAAGGGQVIRLAGTSTGVNGLFAYTNTTGNAPALRSLSGTDTNVGLTLSSQGTGTVDIFTNSATTGQLRISHTASAVNIAEITGAITGGGVRYGVAGSDSNITWNASSKGAFGLGFYTNNFAQLQFSVGHVANAVNRVTAYGAATGGPPSLFAEGSDANISLGLYSKGSGGVFAAVRGAVSAYFDNPASAVNYWMISGSAAGGLVTLTTQGSDTNVGGYLATKGTGAWRFATGGGDQFRIIHVASAVNFWSAYGSSTGFGPILYADGTDAAVNAGYSLRGAGEHVFYTGSTSVVQATIHHTASAVNWLRFTGAATGNAVVISTAGTDTNRSISLTAAGTGLVQITNNSLRIVTSKTPASASATGTQGQIAWDASYIYVCTATDTWKRAAIATW